MGDTYLRETTAKIMKMIRQYPYARLVIGTRAALAFYEILQTLTLLKVKKPLLTTALITLPHRVKSESIIDNERIIKEIIGSFEDNDREQQKEVAVKSLTHSKIVQILRELDNLQDVTYAMPYEINILDPQWFKVGQESLFKPEAPTLMTQTLNKDKRTDFTIFKKILDDLQDKGFIRLKSDSIQFTRSGSLIKYKNVFSYVERAYPKFFNDKWTASSSDDDRRFQSGDSYKNLHVRRTLRTLLKKRKDLTQASREDLRIKRVLFSKKCLVILALDHSWSMARSKKLQYVKDSAAGLVFAVKRNRDKIALIAFSDEAVVLSQPTGQHGLLIEKISQLRPEKETDIADALIKTRMLFSKAGSDCLKHSIIITDGIPTSNSQDVTREELESRILLEVRKMRKMGITVSVICIRDELEENDTSLARKITSIGRGSFSLANAHDLLDQILRDYSDMKSRQVNLL